MAHAAGGVSSRAVSRARTNSVDFPSTDGGSTWVRSSLIAVASRRASRVQRRPSIDASSSSVTVASVIRVGAQTAIPPAANGSLSANRTVPVRDSLARPRKVSPVGSVRTAVPFWSQTSVGKSWAPSTSIVAPPGTVVVCTVAAGCGVARRRRRRRGDRFPPAAW
ncbi:MAG: hypothetical protein EBX36_02810 [Planctomycetia bacterium]|nr:hypothetical protein [Planctomycetia bacterium]